MTTIILIHGFLTNKDDFKNIMNDLNKLYDYVAVYEVPGHTIPPNYKLFNVKDTFKTLLNFYDELALKFDTIDCMGFSMGGALATYLQSVRKINKLILLAPANRYLNFKLLHNRLYFIKKIRKERNKFELNNLNADDKAAFNLAITRLIPHYSIHNLQTFRKIIAICNKELIAITCPVLIIWGKLDQLVPFNSVSYVYDLAINERELVVYDDISHLMLESKNYQKINDKIIDFIKRG